MLWRRAIHRLTLLWILSVSASASAQAAEGDLRALHDRAVYATVHLRAATHSGTGWLLSQPTKPLIVTNRHVAQRVGAMMKVAYYQGSARAPLEGAAKVLWLSSTADLAVAMPLTAPPPEARPLVLAGGNDIVRGQRVVLAANPGTFTFQTTEGVVTGASPELDFGEASCGFGKNCVVVDAAAFSGSSGGPALDQQGALVGMLWAVPTMELRTNTNEKLPAWVANPTFAYLIHVRVIEAELKRWGEENRARGAGGR